MSRNDILLVVGWLNMNVDIMNSRETNDTEVLKEKKVKCLKDKLMKVFIKRN